jgi:poly-beta-1,6-N-acetyl-D-glucosamine synthase
MRERLLIISPVRNEAAHLERVAAAVAAQTRPPDTWIVVDDGSNDGTYELSRRLEQELPFLTAMRASPRDHNFARDHLARAAAPITFNVGLRSVDWRTFSHIGKLDGDVELPREWFERLLEEFREDPHLGIACGALIENRGRRALAIPRHHVYGAVKTYSVNCFRAIGGIQERLGWDTIDETYARMKGYRTRSLPELRAVHHRLAGSADGRLRGRARHGECAYIAHFSVPWVVLRALKQAGQSPVGVSGAAFLYGYLRAGMCRTERVEDADFRRFARWELRRRMVGALPLPQRVLRRRPVAGLGEIQAP